MAKRTRKDLLRNALTAGAVLGGVAVPTVAFADETETVAETEQHQQKEEVVIQEAKPEEPAKSSNSSGGVLLRRHKLLHLNRVMRLQQSRRVQEMIPL